MDNEIRKRAAKTAVDGFIVVERIYRHAYQILAALKGTLKGEYNLKAESPLFGNPQTIADPRFWIYHFRGCYLANINFTLQEYKKGEIPILFLQASLYNPNGHEPILRYGVIEKIFNMDEYKGATFNDYFKDILGQIHEEQKSGGIRATYCEAEVDFDRKLLLDIREDKDLAALAEEIGERYAKLLLA